MFLQNFEGLGYVDIINFIIKSKLYNDNSFFTFLTAILPSQHVFGIP
jgi:hypothetical protein